MLSAGMVRSGSTFQFNVLRLLLESASLTDLISGYDWDVDWRGMHTYNLVKCHNCTVVVTEGEWDSITVFTVHRDLRDVCASSMKTRIKPDCDRLNLCFNYYAEVSKLADADWKYEDVIVEPERFVVDAAQLLNRQVPGVLIKDANATDVVAQINAMVANLPNVLETIKVNETDKGIYPGGTIPGSNLVFIGDKSQFFLNHRSNGSWGSFKKELNTSHCLEISKQYKMYLDRFAYPGQEACLKSSIVQVSRALLSILTH